MRREDPDAPAWLYAEELLAQLIEEVSVFTADMRRKEPRQVPRPGQGSSVDDDDDEGPRDVDEAVSRVLTKQANGRYVARGFAGMLALAARQQGVDPSIVAGITGDTA